MHSRIVQIIVTEPWEVGDAPRRAKVLEDAAGSWLVEYEEPFRYQDVPCQYFILSPRHEGKHLCDIIKGTSLLCSMTRITPEQRNSANPFDLSSWRGGVAFIADVQLTT